MKCWPQRSARMMPFELQQNVFVLKHRCSRNFPEQKLITSGISECLMVTFGIHAGDIPSSSIMVYSRKA